MPTIKRGARKGEKIKWREFFKLWKQGLEGITPLQQTKTTLVGFMPIFAGIIWGIVFSAMMKSFWLMLILIGSLPITGVQFISNVQKYKALKKVDETMKELEKQIKKKEKKKWIT